MMKVARSSAILRATAPGLPHRLAPTAPLGTRSVRPAEPPQVDASRPLADLCAGVRLEGFEAGRRAGLAQGLAECEQRMAEARQAAAASLRASLEDERARCREAAIELGRRLDERLDALRTAFDEARHAHERQAVDLAFVAVQKIVCAPEERAVALKRRLAALLRSMLPHPAPVARLAAEDLAELRQEPAFAASMGRSGIVWAADPAAAPGSCRVETGCGEVDLGLVTALTQLQSMWRAELGGESDRMGDPA